MSDDARALYAPPSVPAPKSKWCDVTDLVRLTPEMCVLGECDDAPAPGEWCSHSVLVPADEVPDDVVMLDG